MTYRTAKEYMEYEVKIPYELAKTEEEKKRILDFVVDKYMEMSVIFSAYEKNHDIKPKESMEIIFKAYAEDVNKYFTKEEFMAYYGVENEEDLAKFEKYILTEEEIKQLEAEEDNE